LASYERSPSQEPPETTGASTSGAASLDEPDASLDEPDASLDEPDASLDDPDASAGVLCWAPDDSWLEDSWTASGAFAGGSTGLAVPADDLAALAFEPAPRLVALAPLRPGNALAAVSANTPVNATLPAISQRLTLRRRYIAASRSIGLLVLGMH
jgi:hypothetical protein